MPALVLAVDQAEELFAAEDQAEAITFYFFWRTRESAAGVEVVVLFVHGPCRRRRTIV